MTAVRWAAMKWLVKIAATAKTRQYIVQFVEILRALFMTPVSVSEASDSLFLVASPSTTEKRSKYGKMILGVFLPDPADVVIASPMAERMCLDVT